MKHATLCVAPLVHARYNLMEEERCAKFDLRGERRHHHDRTQTTTSCFRTDPLSTRIPRHRNHHVRFRTRDRSRTDSFVRGAHSPVSCRQDGADRIRWHTGPLGGMAVAAHTEPKGRHGSEQRMSGHHPPDFQGAEEPARNRTKGLTFPTFPAGIFILTQIKPPQKKRTAEKASVRRSRVGSRQIPLASRT